jgi:2-polyprenyl-3-methyl-5-hydroxy-6-metoxy-1,4-benzoquinol methylase
MDAAMWDEEYRSGRWRYLEGVAELGRYALIASYLRHFVPAGRLLDVGCGEAILFGHLGPAGSFEYTGVDVSAVALETAAVRHPGIRLVAAAAEQFIEQAEGVFDVIVFNEVLYYLDDPIQTLWRYRALLGRRGIAIVSMHYPSSDGSPWLAWVEQIWAEIDRDGWVCLDACQLRNEQADLSWRVAALAAGE